MDSWEFSVLALSSSFFILPPQSPPGICKSEETDEYGRGLASHDRSCWLRMRRNIGKLFAVRRRGPERGGYSASSTPYQHHHGAGGGGGRSTT